MGVVNSARQKMGIQNVPRKMGLTTKNELLQNVCFGGPCNFFFVEKYMKIQKDRKNKQAWTWALFPLVFCHTTLEKSIFSGFCTRITTQRNMKVFPKSARQAQHVAKRTFSTVMRTLRCQVVESTSGARVVRDPAARAKPGAVQLSRQARDTTRHAERHARTRLQDHHFSTRKPVAKRAPNGMRDPRRAPKACTQRLRTLAQVVTFPMKNNQDSNFSGAVFLDIFTYPQQAQKPPFVLFSLNVEQALPSQ